MFKKDKIQLNYLYTFKRRSRNKMGFTIKQLITFASCVAFIAVFGSLLPKIFNNPFKKITVVDGYGEYTLITRADTMGEIYKSGILNMKQSDSTVSMDTKITDNMTIYVDRSIVVNVISGDTSVKIRTSSSTAREVLTKAGITFKESDAFNIHLDEVVQNGDTLIHEMIETKRVTERVSIGFDTVKVEDNSLEKGKTKVIFAGEEGHKEIAYKVTYKGGVEISREVAEERVVKEPISRKIAIGAKKKSTAVASGGSLSSNRPASILESIGSVNDLDPERIAEVRVMTVTAYTHSGQPTATGVMPSIGTVAVHPSEIPLGTKLYIPGYGVGVAQDTGGMTANTIDIFLNTEQECRKWGRRPVTIYILKY